MVNVDFNNILEELKQLPAKFQRLPKDEQAAYGAILAGIVFLMLAYVFWG